MSYHYYLDRAPTTRRISRAAILSTGKTAKQ